MLVYVVAHGVGKACGFGTLDFCFTSHYRTVQQTEYPTLLDVLLLVLYRMILLAFPFSRQHSYKNMSWMTRRKKSCSEVKLEIFFREKKLTKTDLRN